MIIHLTISFIVQWCLSFLRSSYFYQQIYPQLLNNKKLSSSSLCLIQDLTNGLIPFGDAKPDITFLIVRYNSGCVNKLVCKIIEYHLCKYIKCPEIELLLVFDMTNVYFLLKCKIAKFLWFRILLCRFYHLAKPF